MTVPVTLPESELEVMLCLWQHTEPVRTAVLLEQVNQEKQWTLSTLKVLLARLEQKGFIECTRQGRFTLYRALVPQAEYRKKETAGLLGRYYQNSAKQMVASLVECGQLTDTDLAEIAAMIAKAGDADAV